MLTKLPEHGHLGVSGGGGHPRVKLPHPRIQPGGEFDQLDEEEEEE